MTGYLGKDGRGRRRWPWGRWEMFRNVNVGGGGKRVRGGGGEGVQCPGGGGGGGLRRRRRVDCTLEIRDQGKGRCGGT